MDKIWSSGPFYVSFYQSTAPIRGRPLFEKKGTSLNYKSEYILLALKLPFDWNLSHCPSINIIQVTKGGLKTATFNMNSILSWFFFFSNCTLTMTWLIFWSNTDILHEYKLDFNKSKIQSVKIILLSKRYPSLVRILYCNLILTFLITSVRASLIQTRRA